MIESFFGQVMREMLQNDKPNSAHPVTADRFARYEAALREIATIKPSAAGAIAEIALKDDGVTL